MLKITLFTNKKDLRRLQAVAKGRGESYASLVREAIRQYLAELDAEAAATQK